MVILEDHKYHGTRHVQEMLRFFDPEATDCWVDSTKGEAFEGFQLAVRHVKMIYFVRLESSMRMCGCKQNSNRHLTRVCAVCACTYDGVFHKVCE